MKQNKTNLKGITFGLLRGPHGMPNQTQVHHMQSKLPTYCTITPAPLALALTVRPGILVSKRASKYYLEVPPHTRQKENIFGMGVPKVCSGARETPLLISTNQASSKIQRMWYWRALWCWWYLDILSNVEDLQSLQSAMPSGSWNKIHVGDINAT